MKKEGEVPREPVLEADTPTPQTYTTFVGRRRVAMTSDLTTVSRVFTGCSVS